MLKPSEQLRIAAESYLLERYGNDCPATLVAYLGGGQDGDVWETSERTAVKAFNRIETYLRELECYQILTINGIAEIEGFSVPQPMGSNAELAVLELDIVQPPFLLDFGKAYTHEPPYSAEQMEEWRNDWAAEWTEKYWPTVWTIFCRLRALGIYYMDPTPGNIRFADWQDDQTV